jgi:hypothetical protein
MPKSKTGFSWKWRIFQHRSMLFIREVTMRTMIKWVVFLLMAGLAHPVFAGISDGWIQLGTEKVNARMERDEIRAASKGFVKQVVIEVRGAAVYFESVAVHLGDGEVVDLPVRSIIKAGERTRVIDLPGNARLIRKVVFVHQKLRDAGKAEVILWGRK